MRLSTANRLTLLIQIPMKETKALSTGKPPIATKEQDSLALSVLLNPVTIQTRMHIPKV